MPPLRIAFDVGPEHGHRTGIGVAVDALHRQLAERTEIELAPYLLSLRTRPAPPTRRLPLPAVVAHLLWAHVDHPTIERLLGPLDLVHGTNYVVPPSRGPRLVSVYDGWFLAHPEQANPAVRRAAAVLRHSVANGAHVHVSSQATAERIGGRLGTDAITVVHLGPPEPAGPAPGEPSPDVVAAVGGRPVVLALGTLERRKNLPSLVRAFGLLARTDAEVVLVIAGADGDDAAAVADAMADLDLAARARVIRAGVVDGATKRWLLERARVLAYPSLDEGFGFPLLEAQTAGVPVVATRAGSIPEIAGRGVELVEVGDVDDLAEGLRRVVTDDTRRAELIAAGHENRRRFSWADTATAMIALYRRLVEERQ